MKWLMLPVIVGIVFMSPLCRRTPSDPPTRRTAERVLAKGIADAVTQYYGDCNRLPRPASASTSAGNDSDTDTSNAEGFIRILCGREQEADKVQNLRKTNYLEGMQAAKARTGTRKANAKGSNQWISGMVTDGNRLEVVDPWGGYYRIRLDSNYDGEMVNPNTTEVAIGRERLPTRVIVWSPGKDGKWETWDDNVTSWD